MTTTLYPAHCCTLLNARFALQILSASNERDPKTIIVLDKLFKEAVFKHNPIRLDLEDLSLRSEDRQITISIMDDFEFPPKPDANYKFSQCSVALSFMSHLATNKKIRKEFFQDDLRPIICMKPVEFSSSKQDSEESYIVMGVDCTQEDFPFRVRLISRSKFMAGLYRPILSARINKKK